ncbi:DUF4150 domain-containing protein [Citrobacter amalonaticus]|uniref:DUF4150 domain-containing protein n=1 Tax=Citrobacter amalonaticus TaxID=35703 RepID=UPI0009005D8C|nr:DUF4150 domain-containing protein [Citrobacter amalonaticus]AVI00394.1 DUF4150 domain-containing protein [Citrobacter amalonaticus]EKW2928332.1 DUF4150 domain-containing protein [Citrobacter amalonaticus]MBJ9278974.1 DUF4150 domain-containing protein [Citrobacter amalonaticus]HAT3924538.1 DUF4150 domain-containing protein [Citrobacter amalonaticus]HED1255588.1 DUF4150 domain-containing protein [Citrobacter amalonaticus]
MAENYIARKNGQWQVISILPDVCKTPMGPSIPPVPYAVMSELNDAARVVPSVRVNGGALVVFEQSFVPFTLGDEAGTATGIKSGTTGSQCVPKEHSKSVRSGGKPILRHDDEFWMNSGNTVGKITGQPPLASHPATEANPPPIPETQDEQSLWDTIKDFLTTKYDKVPDNFGRGAWLAAGALKNGNVDSYESMARAAGPETLRGFESTYGNGVVQVISAVGYPGLSSAASGIRRTTSAIKEARQLSKKKTVPEKQQKGGGGKSKGKNKDDKKGPCLIGSYATLQCPPGNDKHHIVPDYTLRTGTRPEAIKNQKRIQGMPTLAEGMSICLSKLEDQRTGRKEHKDAHDVDPKIAAIGLLSPVPGTVSLSDALYESIFAVSKVKPECKLQITAVVEAQFAMVDSDTLLRSTHSLPKPEAIAVLGTIAR